MKLRLLPLLLAFGCSESSLPYQSGSPWPKFRGNAVQDGLTSASPQKGGVFWSFPTGKGVFSSPVVGHDGTIYVGSADRTFYAISADGTLKWKLLTGEVIDSAALLDDLGRVYFGSGDGVLRALDAATGGLVWMTPADDPGVNAAPINWFEGNVVMSTDGQLLVPNDNRFLYTVDRKSGSILNRLKTPDQTWSAPAVDPSTGSIFFGNNNVVSFLGKNLFALDRHGAELWSSFSNGTVAASPELAQGSMIVGGFDGYLRAYDPKSGTMKWEFGARDHIYASPSRLKDGTLLQAAADGTLYALAPKTGSVRWTFDVGNPIRSSPSVDGDDHIYFGGGDGRLYVVNPDGTLRWSVRLIADDRNDLNASPALGSNAVYIAGESGEVFSVPYDYCLHADGLADPRCAPATATSLPQDGALLLYTTEFGSTKPAPPSAIAPNQPLAFSLVVRKGGASTLAVLDPSAVQVTLNPPGDVAVDVSGDGRFLTIAPNRPLSAASDGTVGFTITAQFLTGLTRDGLKLSGGTPSGTATLNFQARLSPANPAAYTLPAQGGTWEVSRLALPLPTLLPSYNQIGFDSLHYLVGLVEFSGQKGVAWMIGAKLAADENRTITDPTSQALFALDVDYRGGFLTLANRTGVSVEITNVVIPFRDFRMAVTLGSDGNADGPLRITGDTLCTGIPLYGSFLQQLGLCNAKTDLLAVVGATNFKLYQGGQVAPPTGVGTVTFQATADEVSATLAGTTLKAAEHVSSVLLVDAATGNAVSLDYGLTTAVTADASGLMSKVSIPIKGLPIPSSVRAYLMIDTSPVATRTLPIP